MKRFSLITKALGFLQIYHLIKKEEVVALFKEIPTLSSEGVITDIDKSLTTFGNAERRFTKEQGGRKSVISTSKLELTMIKSDISTNSKSKYNIQTIAVWKSAPFIKSKDQFALAWARNYALITYSSNSYWRTSSGQSVAVSSPVSEIVPNAGVAYEYQCGNSDSNFSFNPWYVQINAVISRAKGNGNNPANVVAKYAHKTVSLGSIGVSISPGIISFSASGVATYDTASPVSTVVYY